jgi:serine acetyltransferase
MKQKKKKTAVEWLVYMLDMQDTITPLDIREAKRIEKEQMIDFARNIIIDATCSVEGYVTTEKDIEEYYNETFKANEK